MRTTDVIGRESELRRTLDFLDAVATGPRGLMIEGEAGAGKNTLWLAAAEEAGHGERGRVLAHELRPSAGAPRRPARADGGTLVDLKPAAGPAIRPAMPPMRPAPAARILVRMCAIRSLDLLVEPGGRWLR